MLTYRALIGLLTAGEWKIDQNFNNEDTVARKQNRTWANLLIKPENHCQVTKSFENLISSLQMRRSRWRQIRASSRSHLLPLFSYSRSSVDELWTLQPRKLQEILLNSSNAFLTMHNADLNFRFIMTPICNAIDHVLEPNGWHSIASSSPATLFAFRFSHSIQTFANNFACNPVSRSYRLRLFHGERRHFFIPILMTRHDRRKFHVSVRNMQISNRL